MEHEADATPARRVAQALSAAVAGTRGATLVYALAVAVPSLHDMAHPRAAAAVLLAMLAWTGVAVVGRPRGWAWHVADVAVAVAALLSTRLVDEVTRIDAGSPTLPTIWVAGAVVAVAAAHGARLGLVAGAVVATASVAERGDVTQQTANGAALLLLVGGLVGLAATAVRVATERVVAAERKAEAAAERGRLARDIHDGVLQLLTVVVRMDPDVVLPDGQRLAAAAAEQERAVRQLLTGPAEVPTGELDLLALLPSGAHVQVVGPADPVVLPAAAATALASAARAALDNVRKHVALDAEAYVLVDDLGDRVEVVVRDDGPGLPPDAESRGRLGLSGMRERLAEVGGTVQLDSPPGGGTEVHLTAPRRPA